MKAKARLHIRAVSPEPSLFTHVSKTKGLKIRHVAPVDCCACVFEDCLRRAISAIIS